MDVQGFQAWLAKQIVFWEKREYRQVPSKHRKGRRRRLGYRAELRDRRKRERRTRRYARLCARGKKHRFRGVL